MIMTVNNWSENSCVMEEYNRKILLKKETEGLCVI